MNLYSKVARERKQTMIRKLIPMVLLVFIIFLCAGEVSAKTVIFNKKNFPDKAMREALYEYELGDKLSQWFLDHQDSLEIEGGNRKVNLKGIEYFSKLSELIFYETTKSREFPQIPKLKELYYRNNAIEKLELPRYPKLETVSISGNKLNSLDLSNNKQIKELALSVPKFHELVVSQFSELEELRLEKMNLQELNLSYNSELETLILEKMNLQGLNLSYNSGLKTLILLDTNLPELDLSHNSKLNSVLLKRVTGFAFDPVSVGKLKELVLDAQGMETFELSDHPALESLEIKNDSTLQKVVIKGCKKLKKLTIKNNSSLQEIQIEGCAKLKELTVANNPLLREVLLGEDEKLTSLSIKKCKNVTSLEQMNLSQLLKLQLVDTSVSKLPTERFLKLEELSFYGNPTKKVDIQSLKNLRRLDIRYEKSTKSLDVSKFPKLCELRWTNGVLEKVNFGKNNHKMLWEINLSDNKLSGKWDMGKFKGLDELRLNNNRITSIDLGKLRHITTVLCRNNKLKTVNAGEAYNVNYLDCRDNPGVRITMNNSDDCCMTWIFGKKSKVYYKYG